MIYGMLLAGISAGDIEQALAIGAGELAARRTAMLAKLEALPGEQLATHAGGGRLDLERWAVR
jgi:hypothetical protein